VDHFVMADNLIELFFKAGRALLPLQQQQQHREQERHYVILIYSTDMP